MWLRTHENGSSKLIKKEKEKNSISSVSLKVLIPINWLINPRIFM